MSQHLIAEVVRLWDERPIAERTEEHVFEFYVELQKNRPWLLPTPKHGDPYQVLKTWLSASIQRDNVRRQVEAARKE